MKPFFKIVNPQSQETPMKVEDINQKINDMMEYVYGVNRQYYALISKDTFDCTIFNVGKVNDKHYADIFQANMKNSLYDRGIIYDIDFVSLQDGFDIKLEKDGVFYYYSFICADIGGVYEY